MYKAFITLFKTIEHFEPENEAIPDLKTWFKNILIEKCIEEYTKPGKENFTDGNSQFIISDRAQKRGQLNPKEIVDRLRNLPAPHRTIFNLAVIDKFNLNDISSKLKMPVKLIEGALEEAKNKISNDLSFFNY